jgi:hypothetical protein
MIRKAVLVGVIWDSKVPCLRGEDGAWFYLRHRKQLDNVSEGDLVILEKRTDWFTWRVVEEK